MEWGREWWGERLGRAMELDDRGDGLGCGAVGGETTMGDVTKRYCWSTECFAALEGEEAGC